MLESLYIQNFALIESLNIQFHEGYNVLTGETGAGKSIVIDAVSMLLGGRAQTEFIRSGEEKAYIEGVFFFSEGHPVYAVLHELEIDLDDTTIILSREIARNGRNISRINGRTYTLGKYKQVGLAIVDIHGQHDHQSLLQADRHIILLDQFGGADNLNMVKTVKKAYQEFTEAEKGLKLLQEKEKDRLQAIDFLTYQLKEIREANLQLGEDEELEQQAKILGNAGKINSYLDLAYRKLSNGENGQAAYDLLSEAFDALSEISRIDAGLDKLREQLEASLYIVEETARDCRAYMENIEFSPELLEQVEKRRQLIKDLCKKYGPTIDDVLACGKKAEEELEKWSQFEEHTEELETKSKELYAELQQKAKILSEKRKVLKKVLEDKVINELKELAMPHAEFSVELKAIEPSDNGMETAEFLISPNPGEPLLPVAKIASGGELSRIMLALKTIMADMDQIGTLIFDEIDSGIGGKAAQKVAEKLEQISNSQQVICVTHSPLIAALADKHLLLKKVIEKERTKTGIQVLAGEERVDELTRMLGGEKQTSDLRRHAVQILKEKNGK